MGDRVRIGLGAGLELGLALGCGFRMKGGDSYPMNQSQNVMAHAIVHMPFR